MGIWLIPKCSKTMVDLAAKPLNTKVYGERSSTIYVSRVKPEAYAGRKGMPQTGYAVGEEIVSSHAKA